MSQPPTQHPAIEQFDLNQDADMNLSDTLFGQVSHILSPLHRAIVEKQEKLRRGNPPEHESKTSQRYLENDRKNSPKYRISSIPQTISCHRHRGTFPSGGCSLLCHVTKDVEMLYSLRNYYNIKPSLLNLCHG